jgi:hypothetical protein
MGGVKRKDTKFTNKQNKQTTLNHILNTYKPISTSSSFSFLPLYLVWLLFLICILSYAHLHPFFKFPDNLFIALRHHRPHR